MRKQSLRVVTGLTMILVLALASAVASGKPQASNRIVANIPFAFSVGYKTMPAGEYTVVQINNSNGLLIQSTDGKSNAVRLSNGVESSKTQSHARLVFNRYGERYFLSQVWNGTDKTGRELTKSSEERNLDNTGMTMSKRGSSASASVCKALRRSSMAATMNGELSKCSALSVRSPSNAGSHSTSIC